MKPGAVREFLARCPASLRLMLGRFPVSIAFLGGLGATTAALHLPVTPQENVKRWSSTNLDNLAQRPASVLVASAFVLPENDWATEVFGAGLAVAVLERIAGSAVSFGVFASGHLLATGATQWMVARGIRDGRIDPARSAEIDVGISYGLAATLGAVTRVLPGPLRRGGLAVGGGYLAALAVRDRDTASAGHLVAYGVGAAWWPVIGRVHLGRARDR